MTSSFAAFGRSGCEMVVFGTEYELQFSKSCFAVLAFGAELCSMPISGQVFAGTRYIAYDREAPTKNIHPYLALAFGQLTQPIPKSDGTHSLKTGSGVGVFQVFPNFKGTLY